MTFYDPAHSEGGGPSARPAAADLLADVLEGALGAERFVRSIKEECLDRLIPFGERHFRHVIAEFVEHYHRERNHQGLANRLIAGTPVADRPVRVRRRQRLGGLLNFYERAA